LIATAFPAGKGDVRREPLALGALLAGFAIDSAAYGMHHVLSQTLVRFAGIAHGQANAIMLTVTLGALRERDRAAIERLDAALGEDATAFAGRIAARTGATRLEQAGVERAALERCADEAAQRAELALTPPAADRAELLALYEAAF
jgi:alcohol dehydrogenase class IV